MLPQALTYSRRRIAQMKVLFGESHSGSELVLKAKYMPRCQDQSAPRRACEPRSRGRPMACGSPGSVQRARQAGYRS